jgi:hypothetical protein
MRWFISVTCPTPRPIQDCRVANASSVRLEPPYGYHTASHRLGRLAIDEMAR